MRPTFLDTAKLEQIGWKSGRAVWQTLDKLCYRSSRFGTVVIPKDFVTDLASVPRIALAYWIAGGRGTRSAILHDFAYQFGYWLLKDGTKLEVSKGDADEEFRLSLIDDPISGAGPVIARVMYLAVRAGGRGVWGNGRSADLNPVWTKRDSASDAGDALRTDSP